MTDDIRRRRIDAHARGERCDACGTRQWPHGDDTEPQPTLFDLED